MKKSAACCVLGAACCGKAGERRKVKVMSGSWRLSRGKWPVAAAEENAGFGTQYSFLYRLEGYSVSNFTNPGFPLRSFAYLCVLCVERVFPHSGISGHGDKPCQLLPDTRFRCGGRVPE